MTEEQAKKVYERALKTEQEFAEYFTGNLMQYIINTIIKVGMNFLKNSNKNNFTATSKKS